jgi:hypothetical protein
MSSAVAVHKHYAAEGRFALRIDGALAGPVTQASCAGGRRRLNAGASDGLTHEPLTVKIGMDKELVEWIIARFDVELYVEKMKFEITK